MKVFVAGATGAIGRRLVPRLISGGHTVSGMTRSTEHVGVVRDMGAKPIVADALDRAGIIQALVAEKPDVVVHQLTALAGFKDLKNFDAGFAVTNRLRTEGTDNLLAGAREAGASLFIAQSYGGWTYASEGQARTYASDGQAQTYAGDGQALATESTPFVSNPPAKQRRSLDAIRHLEQAVTGAQGLVGVAFRYGNFYGPGTGFDRDGDLVIAARKRQFPIVGSGAGVWAFVHADDAATAVLSAMQTRKVGIFNIVDDEPAPVAVWLPELARIIGAPAPWHVPTWLGRLVVGDVGVSMMTRIPGVSNAKAKRELGWRPTYSSWRDGFRADLAR